MQTKSQISSKKTLAQRGKHIMLSFGEAQKLEITLDGKLLF